MARRRRGCEVAAAERLVVERRLARRNRLVRDCLGILALLVPVAAMAFAIAAGTG